MTPRKGWPLGCVIGFGGVLIATLGNHGSAAQKGMAFMLIASPLFALAGPWNKAVTQHADSFSVCVLNLGVGGLALAVMGFAMVAASTRECRRYPVLLFFGVYLRRRVCDLGAADEKQPGLPHCGVWP